MPQDYRASSYSKYVASGGTTTGGTTSGGGGGGVGSRLPSGGYASGSVTQIYEGSKETGATLIYGKPKYYTHLEGAEGTLTTPRGKEIEVQAKKEPSYKEVIEARQKELRESGGQDLTEKQLTELELMRRQEQPREIQVSKKDVERFNKQFKEAGVTTAGELVRGIREGRIKKVGDQYIITQTKKVETTREYIPTYYPPYNISPEETPSYYGMKTYQPYIPIRSEVRASQQIWAQDTLTRADAKAKELYYTNVEKQKYSTTQLGTLTYVSGSIFSGFLAPFWSVARTFRGGPVKVAQNILLPFTPGAEGIIAETGQFAFQTVTDPIKTGSQLVSKGKANIFELAGELAGFKVLFDFVIPVKNVKVTKVKTPKLEAVKPEAVKTPGAPKELKFTEGEQTIIKSVDFDVKTPLFMRPFLKYKSGEIKPGLIYGETPKVVAVKYIPPAYLEYLKANPKYAELMKAELVIPKTKTEIVYTREIVKTPEGKTIIRTTAKEVPAQPYRELDIDLGGGDSPVVDFYKNKVWSNELKRFVDKEKKAGTFKDRFGGEEESLDIGGGGTGGGKTEAGIGQSSFQELNLLMKPTKRKFISVEEEVIRPFEGYKTEQQRITTPITAVALTPAQARKIASTIKTTPRTDTKIETDTKTVEAQISYQKVIPKTQTVTKALTKTKLTPITLQTQAQAQTQVQSQAQVQVQKQSQIQVQIQKQIITTKEITVPGLTEFSFNKKSPVAKGFNVLVRRKGEFKVVSPGALSKKEAISMGASIVEHTAGATFKVEPAKTRPRARFFGGGPSLSRFYKKPGGLFIEKAKHRISTPGEKREITLKGIITRKQKSPFKKRKKTKGIFGF